MWYLISALITLFRIVVSYKDYIRNFKWNPLKYSTKRSLLELTALITKVTWFDSWLTRQSVEHALKWWTNQEESWRVVFDEAENCLIDKERRRKSSDARLHWWYLREKSSEGNVCRVVRIGSFRQHACSTTSRKSIGIYWQDGWYDEWLLLTCWWKWIEKNRR